MCSFPLVYHHIEPGQQKRSTQAVDCGGHPSLSAYLPSLLLLFLLFTWLEKEEGDREEAEVWRRGEWSAGKLETEEKELLAYHQVGGSAFGMPP